jgi:hypothetical protein
MDRQDIYNVKFEVLMGITINIILFCNVVLYWLIDNQRLVIHQMQFVDLHRECIET